MIFCPVENKQPVLSILAYPELAPGALPCAPFEKNAGKLRKIATKLRCQPRVE